MTSVQRVTPNLSSDRCRAALLLIDVVNRFDFPGSDALLRTAPRAVIGARSR